jgi:hypothetical protein
LKNELLHIDSVLVNREIVEVKFACDLSKCKGACCTIESEYGAPLLDTEIEEIKKALPAALPYLSNEHKEAILKRGFFEKKEGELVTRSLDNKACVLVFYENNVAKCALERAYFEGKSGFRKPISCHLFPIRISDFGGDILRYERFAECAPALEKGEEENITIAETCKEALERRYNGDWYSSLAKSLSK